MQGKEHWDSVYATKPATSVSWFQAHAAPSLHLIAGTGVPRSASIIDVGGGASTLVDDLLGQGYESLTVLDISATALDSARARLGEAADRVAWLAADITAAELPAAAFDVWHDRAVFHFLTAAEQRAAYVRNVLRAVKPGGHVIVSTFAEDGPERCSGLPVMRYSAGGLHAEFGAPFELVRHEREDHRTPAGATQKFIYCYCRLREG
ncbi:MAG TPA: class I SAM-dependent methyltransferase [Rhodocyclaceae bacterium]